MWSYRVNLDKRVRSDHPLRRINAVLDLGFVRGQVAHTYGRRGKVKLHHVGNLTGAADAVFRGYCGSLAMLILANAAAGAVSSALTDVGINDQFMKELAATLIPSSSALFVLTRSPSPDRDRLLEELKGLGGKILMSSLSHDYEARLQAALKRGKIVGFAVGTPAKCYR